MSMDGFYFNSSDEVLDEAVPKNFAEQLNNTTSVCSCNHQHIHTGD